MKAPLNEQQDDQLVHQRYAYDIPHPKLQVSAPALFLAAAAPQGSSKEIERYESVNGIGSRHMRGILLSRTCSTETEEVNMRKPCTAARQPRQHITTVHFALKGREV